MSLKEFGKEGVGKDELNDTLQASLISIGQNLIRQLQDRNVDLSQGQIKEFVEAYIDSDGQRNTVVSSSTTANFNTDKYEKTTSTNEDKITHLYNTSQDFNSIFVTVLFAESDSTSTATFDITQKGTTENSKGDLDTIEKTGVTESGDLREEKAFVFAENGNKLVTLHKDENFDYAVREYDCTTPYAISSRTYAGTQFTYTGPEIIRDHEVADNGDKLYLCEQRGDVIQYDISSYDVSGANETGRFKDNDYNNEYAIALSDDGSKAFILDDETNKIYQYPLSTNYEINTADENNRTEFNLTGGPNRQFSFTPDGKRIYVNDFGPSNVKEIELSTAFDISTASYTGKTAQLGQSTDLAVVDDRTRLLWLDDGTYIEYGFLELKNELRGAPINKPVQSTFDNVKSTDSVTIILNLKDTDSSSTNPKVKGIYSRFI